ncbi:hypothetical protein COW99_03165 [Candidatus Roizmanbacteria bacterium CG22_combo_CG10-13_8_21_14_all_38_20]|uniref:Uncharacterized protein n=1 Tax=Candidatus Roizmanbacteria bacterium CG22_combo_CG10-13_8_21_14_all_38_20 TaxID=1974862 RepID=A0A2H0BX54_9BACT|nr:hypothetical protein [Candidatus Microgenomates bacterium]PIP61620.1 MAG: hypothetical protein COW99_03165 [Candidatus Roizmanbacteria bacterium CG22_combo_CG10-13_8_21_14_all_38_20]PJC30557.1 MAG: hypothetical protein CO050_05575 [Candidatus Roizmanbacteria bacterium CG_4_9_14_0_2_um_filter_38_17]
MIQIHPLTQALISSLQISQSDKKDDSPKVEVSETVTFLGALYEKMRNAVEYREGHLVRKAAIERVIRRRIVINQGGAEYIETLVKEMLWGRYLASGSITEKTVEQAKNAATRYFDLRRKLISQLNNQQQINEVSDWIISQLSCKLEFILAPNPKIEAITNYVYQWLRNNIHIENESEATKDILIYLAIQEGLNKVDTPLLRYHLVELYGEEKLFADFWGTYKFVNKHVEHPLRNKLVNYVRKQTAPFLILESIVLTNSPDQVKRILTDEKTLVEKITTICTSKYKQVSKRLRRAAIRSVIYLFLTKAIFAILLEVPFDRYLEGEIKIVPLIINTSMPPILMGLIALLITTPGKDNTKRIIDRIKEIITTQKPNTDKKQFDANPSVNRPLLAFIFTTIYSLTFLLIFGFIIWGLTNLNFNFASQLIFIFFLTVVSFFAYRIRLIPREYVYKEKGNVFAPIIDFLMVPILSVGKRLSSDLSKINVITFIFDFILEAPFKAIFEVFEEWFGFMKSKREEIA